MGGAHALWGPVGNPGQVALHPTPTPPGFLMKSPSQGLLMGEGPGGGGAGRGPRAPGTQTLPSHLNFPAVVAPPCPGGLHELVTPP